MVYIENVFAFSQYRGFCYFFSVLRLHIFAGIFFSSNDIYATIEYAHRVVVDAVENILVNGN